jgi:glutaredoxin-related protein
VTVTGERVETGKETGTSRVTAYIKGTPKHPKLDLGKTVQQELVQTGLELLMEKAKKK